MTAKPRVVCVVVNFNCSELTARATRAIQASTFDSHEVVIVDNASESGSVERLSGLVSGTDVTIIENSTNLGFGAACNVGIRHAHRRGAEFVWVVTPDVTPDSCALAELIKTMDDRRDLGAAGPIVKAGGRFITRSLLHVDRGFFPEHVYQDRLVPQPPALTETDYADGCAILLRLETLMAVGLFRPEFFLYFEETELCLRAARAGWRIGIAGRALVTTRPMEDERNHREYYMVRNSILLARIRHRFVFRTHVRHAASLLRLSLRWFVPRCRRDLLATISGILACWKVRIDPVPSLTTINSDAGELQETTRH